VVDALVQRPQVVIVEDMHSIDEMSRAVLERCVRLARRRQEGAHKGGTLFVVTYCPEKMAVFSGNETFLDSRTLAFEIDCSGYSRSDLQDACSTLFEGGLALSLREEIYRRTGGNPALVCWTLRAMRDAAASSGVVDFDRVTWPRELDLLVKRAFERLSLDESGLLYLLSFLTNARTADEICQIAVALSVGDREVAPSISIDADAVREICGRLAAQGWLRLQTVAGEAGSARWAISNGEIARVVSESRGTADADVFRREVGQAFVHVGDAIDASPFEIFHHLRGRPDSTDSSKAAFEAAFEAARSAERRGDLEYAVRIRDELLEAINVQDSDLWFDVCLEQAKTLEALGVYRDAIEIYKSLGSGRFREPTDEEKGRCQRRMAAGYRQLGEPDQEMAACEEGLRIVGRDPESAEALILTAEMSLLFLQTGLQDDAQSFHMRALDRRQALQESGVEVPLEALRSLEKFQFRTGQFAAALGTEEEICRRSEELADFEPLIQSLVYLGHLHACEGREKFAEECFKKALERARECGSRWSEADNLVRIGRWLLSSGRKVEALEFLESGCDLLVDLGREPETRKLRGVMGSVYFQRLSVEDGACSFESFVRLVEKSPSVNEAVSVFPPVYISARERDNTLSELRREIESGKADSGVRFQTYGDLLVDVGSLSEARDIYRQTLHLPRVKGNPIAVSMVLQKLGRLHRLQGERREALAFFEKSLECLGPVPEKSVLANAYIEVGQIRMWQGDLAHAYEYLLRGLEIFVEVQHPQGREVALLLLARFMREIGSTVLARRLATCVHVLTAKSGHLRWEVEACLLLGALEAESGDTRKSHQLFERVAMLTRTLGLERPRAWLGIETGWSSVRQRDYENAQRTARDCLEASRKLGDQDLLDESMHLLGVVESARENRSKNFLRAVDVLQRALKGSYRRKSALRTRAILLSMARVYAERDNEELALKYVREESALAQVLEPAAPEPFRPAFRTVALRRVTRDEAGSGPTLTALVERLTKSSDVT
jgi:tetratricopeptide (TPR) repeat protein